MTKISRHLCDNCKRFRYGTCTLADLEPCMPVLRDEGKKKNSFLVAVTVILLAGIAAAILFACSQHQGEPTPEPEPVSAVALLRELHKGELTEWDKLVLAIAYTESRFYENAVGKAGDSGVLQLQKIYIDEVNRLHGTEYTISDAFDIDKSIAMFQALQSVYNPTKDIHLGIYFHNKSLAYEKTVLENLAMVERYEVLRKKLLEHGR